MSFESHWIHTPPQPPESPTKRSGSARAGLVVVVAVASGVLGGIVGGKLATNTSSHVSLVTAAPAKAGTVGTTAVAKAADAIAPSVVTISSQSDSGESIGTGIIISADGEVLTNNHVVDGGTTIHVRLAGETEPRDAKVLAADAGNDMALVKITNVTGLTPATFADPASVAVGDPVVAVGYALDLDGGPSVTSGIVSALNRTLTNDNGALNGLIQTDTAISSGNSGGPLINMSGQVIGINTAVARSDSSTAANNIGFAIGVAEVERMQKVLQSEAAGNARTEGYLGVGLADRTDGGSGAVVSEVAANSPASSAGVKVNDIVLTVNNQPITGQGALIAIVRDAAPGDKLTIVVERANKKVTLTATLVARPQG
jgi:putative serine protease PepD